MTPPRTELSLTMRAYRDEDEAAVLGLLQRSLGGGPAGIRSPAFFRWKHRESPFGRSYLLVAEMDEALVGLRAFMRWRFRSIHGSVRAVRAVDTATDPGHQGQGIFSRLTRRAVEDLRDDTDLIFNTPNEKSLPGYLKMGWREVGRVPIGVGIARPARFVAPSRFAHRTPPQTSAVTAAEALSDETGVSDLLTLVDPPDARWSTPWSAASLGWRYGEAPLLDYRAVTIREGDRLVGLAIFRVRPRGPRWESTVSEILVPAGRARLAARLLRMVRRAAKVDHLTCAFPRGSTSHSGALLAGFIRSPGGLRMTANALRADLSPDPYLLQSWSLSLGDLEVF